VRNVKWPIAHGDQIGAGGAQEIRRNFLPEEPRSSFSLRRLLPSYDALSGGSVNTMSARTPPKTASIAFGLSASPHSSRCISHEPQIAGRRYRHMQSLWTASGSAQSVGCAQFGKQPRQFPLVEAQGHPNRSSAPAGRRVRRVANLVHSRHLRPTGWSARPRRGTAPHSTRSIRLRSSFSPSLRAANRRAARRSRRYWPYQDGIVRRTHECWLLGPQLEPSLWSGRFAGRGSPAR